MTSVSVEELLLLILAALEERGVEYAVMRNFEGYPNKVTGDVDLVCRPDAIRAAADEIERTANEHGWKVFLRFARSYVEYVGLCCPLCPERSVLVFEIFRGGTWYGVDYLAADTVLQRRTKNNGVWVAASFHAAILSVFHYVLWNGEVPARYQSRAVDAVRNYPTEFEGALREGFGSREAALARYLIQKEKWHQLIRRRWWYRALLTIRRLARDPSILLRTLHRSVQCWYRSDRCINGWAIVESTLNIREIRVALQDMFDAWHVGKPGLREVKDERRLRKGVVGRGVRFGLGGVCVSIAGARPAWLERTIDPEVSRIEISAGGPAEHLSASYIAHLILDHLLWEQARWRESESLEGSRTHVFLVRTSQQDEVERVEVVG